VHGLRSHQCLYIEQPMLAVVVRVEIAVNRRPLIAKGYFLANYVNQSSQMLRGCSTRFEGYLYNTENTINKAVDDSGDND